MNKRLQKQEERQALLAKERDALTDRARAFVAQLKMAPPEVARSLYELAEQYMKVIALANPGRDGISTTAMMSYEQWNVIRTLTIETGHSLRRDEEPK